MKHIKNILLFFGLIFCIEGNSQIILSEIQDTIGKGYVPITDYDPALATYIQKYMLLQDYLEDSISWASVPVGLHDAVTLAGSYDYITLSGQVITRNQIDLTTDVTGLLPYASLSGAPTLLSQFTDDLGHVEESTTVTDLANGLDISLSTYDITVSPDFVELTTETTIDGTDYIIMHDATTPNDGKITYANLLADIVSDASLDLNQVLTNGNDAGGLDAINFAEVEADEFIGDLRGAVLFKAQAGETLAKGDVVYVSGISGNTTIVSKADADDANKMPAFGVVAAASSSPNPVDIYTFGTLSNLNTSSFTIGDILYVSTTAGQLTATPPTGESALLQNIAKVTRVDNSAGSIKISGAGRTNATPNLNTGRLFVGNASNQAVADGTVYVDIANSRVGIGTSSPLERFVVSGGNMQLRGSTYTDFTDYWGSSNNSAFFTPYGFLGSNGSFAVSLYSNGYRNDSAGFTYIGTNGNTSTASGIDLMPTGDIYFRNGTASGTVLPIVMTIKNGGNTGIGTSSPTELLHVNGYARFGNRVAIGNATTSAADLYIYSTNNTNIRLADGSEYIDMFYNSDATSTSVFLMDLDPTNASGTAVTEMRIDIDNVREVTITPTGMGLGGITEPSSTLDVNGDVEIATVNTDNTTDDVLVHSSDGTVSKRTLTSIGDEIDLNLGDDNLTLTGFRTVNLSNNDLQFQMNGTGVGHGGFWYFDASANALLNYSKDNGAGGNYGIFGMSNPSSGFDLVERFNFFGGDGTSNYNIRIFDQTSTTGAKEVRIYNGALRLYDSGSASDIYLNPDGNSYIVNRLGIGTNSPSAKLHVLESVSGDVAIFENSSTNQSSIRINGDDTAVDYLRFLVDSDNNYSYFIRGASTTTHYDNVNTYIWRSNNSVERMRLNATGLGIGTTSPAKQLEIENTGADATMLVQTTDDYNAYIEYQNNSGGGGLNYRTGVTTLEHWDISSSGQIMLRLDRPNNRVQVINQELRVSSTGSEHIFFNTDNWGIRDQFANLVLYFDATSSNPLGTSMTTYNNDLYWVFDSSTDDYQLRTGSYDNLKYEKTTGTIGEYWELGFDELKVYSETDFFTLTKVDHAGGFPETASFEFTDGGYIRTSSGIEHKADSDTEMFFADDIIRFYAGGKDLLHLEERAGLVNRVVINQNSTACEFRVESDTDENAIFMNGTSGDIGFGTNTPSAAVDIIGDLEVNGEVTWSERAFGEGTGCTTAVSGTEDKLTFSSITTDGDISETSSVFTPTNTGKYRITLWVRGSNGGGADDFEFYAKVDNTRVVPDIYHPAFDGQTVTYSISFDIDVTGGHTIAFYGDAVGSGTFTVSNAMLQVRRIMEY